MVVSVKSTRAQLERSNSKGDPMRPRTIAIISGWRHPDGPRNTVRLPATRAADAKKVRDG
jgi:hypothetical protein